MNYLLDTCVVSDFFKKVPTTIEHFKSISPKQILISTISLMEIEYGLNLNPQKEQKIRPIWEALLSKIKIVPFTESCAKATASIRSDLKNSGKLIGPYDILIAGTAIAHDLIVVTSNVNEFARISSLTIEDWREI